MTLEERIRQLLNENSGGMKMTALVTELQEQLRGKLLMSELETTLRSMSGVNILEYAWTNKVKEFVYFTL